MRVYSAGFDRGAMAPFSWRKERLTRASTKRSSIWTIRPRCFFSIGGGPRRTGGEIFSNVKTGTAYPLLIVELEHSLDFPTIIE
jgi:hypothetical protein